MTYDPKVHCGGRSKRTGEPCRMSKGMRTGHAGSGKCFLHGGNSPNGKKFAQREAAENALVRLAIAPTTDPVGALFEAVSVAAWRERGLRQMLLGRESLFGPDHSGDQREDVVSAMHDRALKRVAELAKMAIDAGIDERMIRIAERQGEEIHRIIVVALEAAGVKGDARIRAEQAAVAELAAVAPTGDERN